MRLTSLERPIGLDLLRRSMDKFMETSDRMFPILIHPWTSTWSQSGQVIKLTLVIGVIKRGMNHCELLIGGTGNGLDYKVE